MKITRGLSGLIATFVTITAVHSNFTYAEHKEDDFELIHSNQKITTELEEIMSSDVQNAFPVVVWTNNVSESELEDRIEVEIGFGIDSLEEEYSRPSNELIEELKRNAAGDYNKYLELLMAEYLDITDSARELEFKKTEKYKETKRAIYEEINTTCIYHVYEETGISNEKIRFVSRYAPMSVCCLTFEEINRLAQNNIVEEISLYEPIEAEVCTADFGTTKSTMGINKINNLLSLTGNGVNIGIYEADTVSQTYYAINGINASQVTIVGSTCGIGDHSTYCAGIAAGSAGIAPGANIYSASSHSDSSVFSWTNYDEVQMSDLEALISDGADIINMSWHWAGQGNVYNNYAKYIDYLIADTNTTIVCASGNDATQYLGAPGTAYNAITVNGFLDQYNNTTENILNNYGYNHGNGCYKPDVVAPSLHNGTSTATPFIAGMIALMYQFKPSLKAMPETTKAILIGSCHEKCMKLLVEPEIGDPWIENLTETMTGGLTDRQGAGIPNMYRMISMVSQHTYGNGVLDSYNNYERYVKFLQPKYNSSNINISMAFLQTNVPSDTTSGMKDDIDISTTNNNSTISSLKGNSSTEMVYRSLTNDNNYTLRIYKYGGNSDSIRYGYAWSTDNERYYPNYEDEGVYYLKNYNSSYYLARNNADNTVYQTNAINGLNSEWVLDCTSPSSHLYALKCGDILSNGLGLGSGISPNNYYALEGPNSMTSAITVQFNSDTGTYTFKRNVNGAVYALGINGQSTSVGAYANWLPYSANNKSQKWYLETVNYRPGDANYDGAITENDKLLVQQYLLNLYTINNNLQKNLFDANRDNSIDMSDAIYIAQMLV